MRYWIQIIVTHKRAALTNCDYQLHIENGRMIRAESKDQDCCGAPGNDNPE